MAFMYFSLVSIYYFWECFDESNAQYAANIAVVSSYAYKYVFVIRIFFVCVCTAFALKRPRDHDYSHIIWSIDYYIRGHSIQSVQVDNQYLRHTAKNRNHIHMHWYCVILRLAQFE